ncbi:Cytochrome b5 isoform B, partial [Cucurbita argyrosperma subsp. sororia]
MASSIKAVEFVFFTAQDSCIPRETIEQEIAKQSSRSPTVIELTPDQHRQIPASRDRHRQSYPTTGRSVGLENVKYAATHRLQCFQSSLQFQQMDSDKKVFTLKEVAEHNNHKDCWLIISGKVYDVTKFLEDHPGGDDVLLSATGKDATDDFEDVGHSDNAREMMDQYYVGEIDASTIPKKVAYTPPKQPHYNQDKTSEFIIKLLQFLVPLAILGLAVAIRFYTKQA